MSDGYPVKAGQYLHTDTVSPLATTEGKLHVKAPDLESVIADLATDSRLELVRSLLASLDGKTATEETAEQVKSVLDAISDKVASETTLTQAVEKLNDLLDRLDQKLTIDGEVQLKGHIQEFAVSSWDEIAPDEVPAGSVAILIGTSDIRQTDGKEWLPI